MVEALLFASAEPLVGRGPRRAAAGGRRRRRPARANCSRSTPTRGVNLVQVAGKWAFRTAGDLSFLLSREAVEQRRLSRAALETLAIIAYHQPVTRADIEEIRGVATSSGTLDVLLESGWIRMRGRRRTPGRPVTYGTTEAFLSHFGLDTVGDLPGVEELKAAGLLDARVPAEFLRSRAAGRRGSGRRTRTRSTRPTCSAEDRRSPRLGSPVIASAICHRRRLAPI